MAEPQNPVTHGELVVFYTELSRLTSSYFGEGIDFQTLF